MSEVRTESRRAVSIERTVEWVDTDASGHQHNSVIIRWVEAAEARMMRELGLPEYFPQAPRVQQLVNFTGMLWFGQGARTDLWIEKVGGRSLTFSFEITAHSHGSSSGGMAAHGTVTTVHVPAGATETQPWPEETRNKLEGKA